MVIDGGLQLNIMCPIRVCNAGLFVSRGRGIHPTRVINSHELIFVKQGRLDMWEESCTFSLQQGQALHLWPGKQHGGAASYPPDLSFYWIHFEVDQKSVALGSMVTIPQVTFVNRPDRLENLFRQFLDDQEYGCLPQTSANLLMMLMLCEVAQSSHSRGKISDTAAVLAGRADTYIRLHYERPISVTKIADVLGYNPDYLGRAYRKVYGRTLTESIHRRRLQMARRHLLDSGLNIAEIARCWGFADGGYFRRLFRRYEGMSPAAFRRLYARVHVNTE